MDKINGLTNALAEFVTDYAEDNGLDFSDVVNALGSIYVTYGFTVKGSKISNEELSKSLVEFVSASCAFMVEALRNAKEA